MSLRINKNNFLLKKLFLINLYWKRKETDLNFVILNSGTLLKRNLLDLKMNSTSPQSPNLE
jgi:hypothetical protein